MILTEKEPLRLTGMVLTKGMILTEKERLRPIGMVLTEKERLRPTSMVLTKGASTINRHDLDKRNVCDQQA
nr:hypothetical protein CFP56_74623 [Quercus suber]